MITYDEFEKYFTPIKTACEFFDVQAEALEKLFPSSFVVPETGKILEEYITLLEFICNDSEHQWIEYYVWDCELGKAPKTVWIDELTFELDSLEKLYMILAKGAA